MKWTGLINSDQHLLL